jgi:predicted ABC-type sugar transport system permease subunit
VLAGGLVAGTLAIVCAWVFWALKANVPFARILQSVAAGVLGKASFQGGGSGIMNYVVVPLSAAGPGSRNPLWIALSIVVHMLLIGVPIALLARRGVVGSWSLSLRG